jgi:hypothetical protein
MLDHVETKSENPSIASAKGVWWSTSAKCEDTNIALEQDKPWFISPIILGFFSLYNYVLLDCAFKFIGIE